MLITCEQILSRNAAAPQFRLEILHQPLDGLFGVTAAGHEASWLASSHKRKKAAVAEDNLDCIVNHIVRE